MTSAEFVAKYRVLKTLTEHGARSQIAQEVALGRMVMVHHLDVGSQNDRQRMLTNLSALEPAASSKVLEVLDVDGVKVIVTQFLATFKDLPSWLQEHSAPAEAATLIMSAVQVPPPRPAPQPVAPPPPPISSAAPPPPPPASPAPLPPSVSPLPTPAEPMAT